MSLISFVNFIFSKVVIMLANPNAPPFARRHNHQKHRFGAFRIRSGRGKTCLINQEPSPALSSVCGPTTKKGHFLFQGCELGIYPFCDPGKDNCEDLMCPYWVVEGHTS